MVERPPSLIEELLVNRPVPVDQIAKSPNYAGYSHGTASENPAQHDLPPSPGRRFGEDIAKLKNNTVPCRYKRCMGWLKRDSGFRRRNLRNCILYPECVVY
jgi:hypothetical protein